MKKQKKSMYLVEDFNHNVLDYETNTKVKKILTLFSSTV